MSTNLGGLGVVTVGATPDGVAIGLSGIGPCGEALGGDYVQLTRQEALDHAHGVLAVATEFPVQRLPAPTPELVDRAVDVLFPDAPAGWRVRYRSVIRTALVTMAGDPG